jgi:hypothetical protein
LGDAVLEHQDIVGHNSGIIMTKLIHGYYRQAHFFSKNCYPIVFDGRGGGKCCWRLSLRLAKASSRQYQKKQEKTEIATKQND